MKQFSVPKEMEVNIDFDRPGIPYTANVLRPILFIDAQNFCCVLGPDPQEGVFGCGSTPEEALQDWDKHLFERVEQARPGDELVSFVKHNLIKPRHEATDHRGIIEESKRSRQLKTTESTGDHDLEVTVEHQVRKNTTDQSNADGSEFR
jgi:hypothetical protein